MLGTITLVGLLVASITLLLIARGHLPRPFRNRSCQGRGWRSEFPDASKEAIRTYLTLFVEAFAFARSERLKLNPDDRIIDIYRAMYPIRGLPDSLELETLSRSVHEKYGIDFEGVWSEKLTLGALFRHVTAEGSK